MSSMKDCSKVQPLLAEYVDGALADDSAWDVKLHVASCAVCSRIADDFRATSRLLGTLERAEPSASFEDNLARRLADLSLQPRRPATPWDRVRLWWSEQSAARRPAALASAAALAALLPLAVVIAGQRAATVRTESGSGPRPVAAASAAPDAAPAPAPARTEDTLRELWDGHTEYASSMPLGDQAALLNAEGEL